MGSTAPWPVSSDRHDGADRVIGVIVFQWIGFELQTNASEEMDNPQRDIPRAVYASVSSPSLATRYRSSEWS